LSSQTKSADSTVNEVKPSVRLSPKKQAMALLFGGLLPIIAFTVVEELYGVIAGLVIAMIFGVAEVIYEFIRYKKVNSMTWIGNSLVLGLGGISLISSEGLWFKLQPAILEFGFFIFLLGSWLMRKPFLVLMIEKQNPTAPPFIKVQMSGITLRLSLFMLFHSVLATWAAYYWSTEAWALLKGVGLTISMIIYMMVEIFWAKFKISKVSKISQQTK